MGGYRFNSDRVTSGIAKLKSARKNVSQKRMDRYFLPGASAPTPVAYKRGRKNGAGFPDPPYRENVRN